MILALLVFKTDGKRIFHNWKARAGEPGVTSADGPDSATRRARMSAGEPRLGNATRASGPHRSDATGADGPGSASSATATR